MALTKEFRETVQQRAQKDTAFRRAMLIDAISELLTGDLDTAKSMLRDYINATITFEKLAKKLHKNSKSLQRMFGPSGNPTAQSLCTVIKVLQKQEGIALQVNSKNHKK